MRIVPEAMATMKQYSYEVASEKPTAESMNRVAQCGKDIAVGNKVANSAILCITHHRIEPTIM